MPTTQKLGETDEGQLDLKGNEVVLKDKTSGDPNAYRALSKNGGIVKYTLDVDLGDGKYVEIGYLFGKQDERYPGQHVGEFEFWLKAPGQAAADTKVCSFRHDGIVGAGGGHMQQMWDGTGEFFAQMQNDGVDEHGQIVFNFVGYEASTPFNIGNPKRSLFSINDILDRLTKLEAKLK